MKNDNDTTQQAFVLLGEHTQNHTSYAYLDLRNPGEFILEKDPSETWLTLAIQAHLMDELALSWCKQRQLTLSTKTGTHITENPSAINSKIRHIKI